MSLLALARWATEPVVQRATSELRAADGTAHGRPSTLDQITLTELRMAQLVREGRSNMEVAEVCRVPPRTVGFHLRSLFTGPASPPAASSPHFRLACSAAGLCHWASGVAFRIAATTSRIA